MEAPNSVRSEQAAQLTSACPEAPRAHNEVGAMNPALQIGGIQSGSSALAELCRRYEIKELALFGSAARGEIGPESDIDILVEFEPGASIGMVRFESLAEELESLAGCRVDLVTKRGLKPW